jgi:outer membrane protein assembly factor BamB
VIRRFWKLAWLCGLLTLFGCNSFALPELEPTANLDNPISPQWTYQSGGAINQAPLIIEDLAILLPADGALTALDLSTGSLRWQYAPPEGLWERSYAGDGNRIFLGLKGGEVAAVDTASGAELWRSDLEIDVQVPPRIGEDVVYFSTTFVGGGLQPNPHGRAKVYALNAASGEPVWEFETQNYALQTPAKFEDFLYVGGSFQGPEKVEQGGYVRIYALDATNASVRWIYETINGFPKGLYAGEHALVFVGYQDVATGVDAQTGEQRWRRDTGNWVPTLIGAEEVVYFGSANTVVHALRAADGEPVWHFNIPGGSFNYVLGAPVRHGDNLYFLSQHGDVLALDAETGSLGWQVSTGIAAARTGLSVGNGALVFGDAQGMIHAYTLDE